MISIGNSGSCSLIAVGTPGTSINSTCVTFVFGDLCNLATERGPNDDIIVKIIGVVQETTQTHPIISATTELNYNNQTIVTSHNTTVQLVTPQLDCTIGANTSVISAGSVIRYEIAINHTGDSSSAAYNISVSMGNTPYIVFLPGCTPTYPLVVDIGTNGNVTVTGPIMRLNNTFIFTLCALVLPDCPLSSTIEFDFTLIYHSAPVTPGLPVRIGNVTHTSTFVTPNVTNVGVIGGTSNFPLIPGNHNVSLGDIITIISTIKFPAGTTINPSFSLTLPSEGNIVIIIVVVITPYTPDIIPVPFDSNNDGINDTVRLEFPPVLVYPFPIEFNITTEVRVITVNTSITPTLPHCCGCTCGFQQYNNSNANNETVSDTQIIPIWVNPLPVPTTYNITTDKNTPIVIDLVTGNTSPGQTYGPDVVRNYTQPSYGTVTTPYNTSIIVNSSTAILNVTYTPGLNFVGNDSFYYEIVNGIGGSGTTVVIIIVNPKDFPPVPGSDHFETPRNNPIECDVLTNDSDIV